MKPLTHNLKDMELSTLLKRANFIRFEILIDGGVANCIDHLTENINSVNNEIIKREAQIISDPVTAERFNKITSSKKRRLQEYINRLSEELDAIISKRPLLKEKIFAIV